MREKRRRVGKMGEGEKVKMGLVWRKKRRIGLRRRFRY